jgi:TatD DNase family protein
MRFIDVHSHCNFNAYTKDVEKVIQRALENKVWLINVGSQFSTGLRACQITSKYEKGVYASIGLHPVHLNSMKIFEEGHTFISREENLNLEMYQTLINSYETVVAIGEIGLDYHWIDPRKADIVAKQHEVFKKQFNFAYENNLPVIIHCRKAHDDLYMLLKELVRDKEKRQFGVIHNYYGSISRAEKYIDLGFLLSFTGIITYNDSCKSLIRKLPLDKILTETDCPYLVPKGVKEQRNEPIFVKYVAQRIAEIKQMDLKVIANNTVNNAMRLFQF